MSLILAAVLAPRILPPERVAFELVMLIVMLACIGYAVSAKPARWISEKLKRTILNDKRP